MTSLVDIPWSRDWVVATLERMLTKAVALGDGEFADAVRGDLEDARRNRDAANPGAPTEND